MARTLPVLGLPVRVNSALHRARPLWAPGALGSALSREFRDRQQLGARGLGRAGAAPAHLPDELPDARDLLGWQQTQLGQFSRSDRDLTWLHLVFLLRVMLMPFSTVVLAGYITYRLAVAVYWLNIVLLGGLLYAGARYARRASLVKEDVTAEMTAASERRIIADQAPYAFGALPLVFSTYLSIGFIVATQLNAAITPRIWPLDRFWARPLQDQLKGDTVSRSDFGR